MKRNQIPNWITGGRIVLTAVLLFVPARSVAFMGLYVCCGLSDMLDGFFARRLHVESVLGARLDSAADGFFVCAMLLRLWPLVGPPPMILAWAAGIAALRIAAAIAAKVRFGKFSFLHTYGNKFTGLLLFFYPLTLSLTRSPMILSVLCAVATLSACEELLIELTTAEWDADRIGILAHKGKVERLDLDIDHSAPRK